MGKTSSSGRKKGIVVEDPDAVIAITFIASIFSFPLAPNSLIDLQFFLEVSFFDQFLALGETASSKGNDLTTKRREVRKKTK